MSGYRQHSFDPDAYEQAGAPLRPFNYVQWTGVALGLTALTLELVHVASRLGWIEPLFDRSPATFLLALLGIALINSRREPSTLVGSDQLRKNRRWLLVTTLICVAALGVATLIEFTGA